MGLLFVTVILIGYSSLNTIECNAFGKSTLEPESRGSLVKYGGELNTKIDELQVEVSKINDSNLGETADKFFQFAEESALELVRMRQNLKTIDEKIKFLKAYETPNIIKVTVNKLLETEMKDVNAALKALQSYETAAGSEKAKKKQELMKALEIKKENEKKRDGMAEEITKIATNVGLDIDIYE